MFVNTLEIASQAKEIFLTFIFLRTREPYQTWQNTFFGTF